MCLHHHEKGHRVIMGGTPHFLLFSCPRALWMASQKPDERQPNSTKQPRTYTDEEKECKNALQSVSCAKKAQKSAHFDALEKEMKSEIERLKTEKKRLEDDV